jgi:acetyl esterase
MHVYNTLLTSASQEVVNQLGTSDKLSHNTLKILDLISFNFHALIRRKIADRFFFDNSSPFESNYHITDIDINTTDNHKIPIRLYTPEEILTDRTILFVHGGGWVQGSIETHDCLSRKIANMLATKVISVGYRLSPEYKFPVPLNDVLEAYKWSINNGYSNIILCGDSVGGNLCAALCVKLAEIGYAKLPTIQILFYPILSGNLESQSFRLFEHGYGLTKEWVKNYIYQYTGAEYNDNSFRRNKLVHPLSEKADIFPRTILISAGCDVLLDAQIDFAEKLKKANKLICHEILDGVIHGFMTYGKQFESIITNVLKTVRSQKVLFSIYKKGIK